MTIAILAVLLSASVCYIVTLLNQISRMGNKHSLRITGLEFELHEALEAVVNGWSLNADTRTLLRTSGWEDVADPLSPSGIALAAMIAEKEQQIVDAMAVPKHMQGEACYDPGEGGEHASCLASADPSKHSGFIILDDPHLEAQNVELVHDDELSARLRSSIARRAGEDTPIIHIIAKVHEEDVILDGELDLSYLLPTHIRGTHPYSFRTGEWARITGIEIMNLRSGPRHVFKAVYDDDAKDTVAICDSANYETK